jgi:DNA repair exonuclease SbcCD ATPase subunit
LEEKLENNILETDYDKYISINEKVISLDNNIQYNLEYLEEKNNEYSSIKKSYYEYLIDNIEANSYDEILINITQKIKLIKDILQDEKNKISKLHTEKINIEIELSKFKDIRDEINVLEKKRTILEYIKNILDKNGLVDTLLTENIIPSLQNTINSILSDIGHYYIDIKYKNQAVNIYKYNTNCDKNDNRGLNIMMSSGYESYLLDLVFRLALVQVNSHIKTDFLVIDEGFNVCDSDNKNNIKDLLEIMKKHYKWILIISHDEFIKSFYDTNIMIESSICGSKLNNLK